MMFHLTPDRTKQSLPSKRLYPVNCWGAESRWSADVGCTVIMSCVDHPPCLLWLVTSELLTWVLGHSPAPIFLSAGLLTTNTKQVLSRLFSIITWKLIWKVWPNVICTFEYSLSECWDYANVFSQSYIGCMSTCQQQEITFKCCCNSLKRLLLKITIKCKVISHIGSRVKSHDWRI